MQQTALSGSATFRSPPPTSLGYRLRQDGKPAVLLYVIPLLIEEGFCTAVKEGRGYVIRHAATQNP